MVIVSVFQNARCERLVKTVRIARSCRRRMQYLILLAKNNRGWRIDESEAVYEECIEWNRMELIARCYRVFVNEGCITVDSTCYDNGHLAPDEVLSDILTIADRRLLVFEYDDGELLKFSTGPYVN